jgi:hypothetical protein
MSWGRIVADAAAIRHMGVRLCAVESVLYSLTRYSTERTILGVP